MTFNDQIYRETKRSKNAMNAFVILNKIFTPVSQSMHKYRQKAVKVCILSLLKGNAATVTSIGRGIGGNTSDKHNIKRADRLLSNPHLLTELPLVYDVICRMVCSAKHPVIAVDWSDLDEYKGHFLLRAVITVEGRSVTLYQEIHSNKTKEKPAIHKGFLTKLHQLIPEHCQPIIVTDAGFKSPWEKEKGTEGLKNDQSSSHFSAVPFFVPFTPSFTMESPTRALCVNLSPEYTLSWTAAVNRS